MKINKIVIAAGGTGGHVFPAQHLALEFLQEGSQVLFIGNDLHKNRFFAKDRFMFVDIDSSSIHLSLRYPIKMFRMCKLLLSGFMKSLKELKSFKPDVVIGFGSFHSFPVILAARFLRVPIVLYEPNIKFGKSNIISSKFSNGVGTAFPTESISCKVRKDLLMKHVYIKDYKCEQHHKDQYDIFVPDVPTILIFGGSQGAKSLNTICAQAIEIIAMRQNIQVIHFVGKNGNSKQTKMFYDRLNINNVVKDFESNINIAMSLADLAICRAGASSIEELIENTLPALLVPYPYAYGHQEDNARFFSEHVGGGSVCRQEKLTPIALAEKTIRMIKDNVLEGFKYNIGLYKRSINPDRFSNFVKACMTSSDIN